MEQLLNISLWKKAYLLEFRTNNALTDAFTFSVPPESEEFNFPQRKAETKTFGGCVVADYGNDLVQINLSGSTINQNLKLIYKSRLGATQMTGEQEIFYLRDLLRKYGKRENLKNKEIYLYSLNGGNVVRHNPKWWKIYVGQLDISRDKSKPFCYNYKFSATGDPEVVKKSKINFDFLADWKAAIETIVYAMTRWADLIEEYGGGLLSELSRLMETVSSTIDAFNGVATRYADVTNGIITGAMDLAKDTVMLGDKTLYSAFRYYPTITAEVWNTCLNTQKAAEDLYKFCSSLDETYFSESSWQSIKELFDDSVSDIDIADTYTTLADSILSSANTAVAETSKILNDESPAVIPGDTNEDDKIILTYGYKVVTITDAETAWDQLAEDYYGDSSLSYLLATYNNMESDKPLTAGQKVLIPHLDFAQNQNGENEVYNKPDEKDNYGKDLIILEGDFTVSNGDLKLVGGTDNLQQALLNRYATLIGARIRVEAYGIQASIGDAVKATSALIQASVHQTTIEDPRVESVEDIKFEGIGDKLAVVVVYIDKNGSKNEAGGTI